MAKAAAVKTSEVQNIQVADGNILEGMNVPLFMVFPRYYSCPSLQSCSGTDFAIHFQVNIAVVFETNHVVSEVIPIKLYR